MIIADRIAKKLDYARRRGDKPGEILQRFFLPSKECLERCNIVDVLFRCCKHYVQVVCKPIYECLIFLKLLRPPAQHTGGGFKLRNPGLERGNLSRLTGLFLLGHGVLYGIHRGFLGKVPFHLECFAGSLVPFPDCFHLGIHTVQLCTDYSPSRITNLATAKSSRKSFLVLSKQSPAVGIIPSHLHTAAINIAGKVSVHHRMKQLTASTKRA